MFTTSKLGASAASIVDREGAERYAAQHAAPSSSQPSLRHSSASPLRSAAVPPERRRPMRRPDLGEQAPHRDCSKPCSGGSPARLCAGRPAVRPVASSVPHRIYDDREEVRQNTPRVRLGRVGQGAVADRRGRRCLGRASAFGPVVGSRELLRPSYRRGDKASEYPFNEIEACVGSFRCRGWVE